jgi:sulfite exporter TauE/SafE/copper chaperone CopZ
MKKYIFHVNGMHCKACVGLTESELSEVAEVSEVKASLANLNVEVTGEFGDKDPEHIARDLSEVLKPHGYTLTLQKQKHSVKWSDFRIALPIALGFVVLFIVLQKLGIVNLVTASEVGYGTAFVIGLIASVSTCMAVVGGLVLSMSSSFAKESDGSTESNKSRLRPQILFHISRLVSFFVLGGLIGVLGSAFQLGVVGTFVLSFIVAVVLLILGINLLDIFPWVKKLQPTLPSFIGKRVGGFKKINHTLTPILIGMATFFLPCGFTQSMQIYTLTTGNFWMGALIMFAFALGTLPVLALLSFSSLSIHKKTQSGVFFKVAGLVVIFFGLFNLINALVGAGIIPPLFNF